VAGEPVLRGVSFEVAAGETVAIVGPTGSGKTSLVNLVLRTRDPDSGCVRVSGHDLSRVDIGPLRRKMALVSQDPFLFSGSVRDNILLGQQDLTEAQFDRLLDLAQCRELVQRLPRGLDTPLSEAGKSLSSGERQLISIARALARDPQLIILDEATSYIDAQTEARIQQALARLTSGRTTLLVAHRLSTARHADRIVVLHRGRVLETGSHDALMQRQGFYHRLVQVQGEGTGGGRRKGE